MMGLHALPSCSANARHPGDWVLTMIDASEGVATSNQNLHSSEILKLNLAEIMIGQHLRDVWETDRVLAELQHFHLHLADHIQ
jgi:hypothetical protein